VIFAGRPYRHDMGTILSAIVSIFAFRFRSRASLELKLITLQHQLAVLRRQRPGRPHFSSFDRLLWVWLYRIWPQLKRRPQLGLNTHVELFGHAPRVSPLVMEAVSAVTRGPYRPIRRALVTGADNTGIARHCDTRRSQATHYTRGDPSVRPPAPAVTARQLPRARRDGLPVPVPLQ
jgi:hypothetical protein